MFRKISSIVIIVALLAGCTTNTNIQKNTTNEGKVISSVLNGEVRDINYEKTPKRIVSLAGFATEMLLALGLEDKIVGYAWQDNEVLPQYQEKFNQLHRLCPPGKDPGKEVVLSMEPDIVLSWASTSKDDYFSYPSLQTNDILTYGFACEQEGATLESVYQDFINLGKIFDVEDRANQVVDQMKQRVETVQQRIQGKEAVSVFVFDVGSSEEQAFTAGGGLVADIIEKAGGKNSIQDTSKNWTRVSYEKVAEVMPEWIIIDYYTDKEDVKGSIEFLKNHPALKEIPAVKQEKFIILGLTDISASERNDDTIELLASYFHPNK